MNLSPISQSLILAGESPEVDVLARRAVPVPTDSPSRDVALQFTSVGNNSHYADPPAGSVASGQTRAPVDLYRRVQRANSQQGSRQLVDVFA